MIELIGRLFLLIGGSVGAFLLYNAGSDMSAIESVAGNTVAESYYQLMGDALKALAVVFGSLSVGLALKDFSFPEIFTKPNNDDRDDIT
jgi:hypothetical protein